MEPELRARLQEARQMDRAGQYGRAVLAYKMVLRADPGCLEAKVDLSGLLMMLGRFEEALELCHEALAAAPGLPSAQQNLIGALLGLERYEEADGLCRSMLLADPGCAPAHLGLGMSLACRDRHLEADAAFLRAQALDPADVRIRNALLTSRLKRGAWPEAWETWMAIADRDIGGAAGIFEKGVVNLTYGRFEEGWAQYESRTGAPHAEETAARPRWDGAPFPGRTLLLHWEQGLGDTLMAIRYAALARARGGRVTALVQAPLLPVLRGCAGVDQWLVPGEPLPEFHCHLPLMSLPGIFWTGLAQGPATVPYLRAPEGPRPELAASGNLKVGLVWAGNTAHKLDFMRSLPPAELAPLAALPGVDWYSLQLGYEGGDPWPGLATLAPHLTDFGATARILEQLDLLISVDTGVVHLAGALGRPAWVLLPLWPDWRWQLEGPASPWYPTLRLFRQREYSRWTGVVAEVGAALAELLQTRRGTC